jgi:LuxR family maltose regulon positive regulatory protein
MYKPLLDTKLHIPARHANLIQRPRLIELLNQGCHSKMTIISTPTGYGKTTLLCQWQSNCNLPVAWLTLDKADNDPVRFLSYLIAALQRFEPDLGSGALDVLQTSGVVSAGAWSPIELALTLLLNDLTSGSRPLILVLDDYHLIENARIHQLVTYLLDNQPEQLHLVIATRVDPPLPVSRLRAQAQLVEVRVDDLCFTSDESFEFYNDVMGLSLSTEQVAVLERRTEGWIAGLQLAALSMREHEDIIGFIEAFTGSHRFILDYLTEEVFNRQSSEVRAFLLKTAILDHLNASLCNAITRQDDSQEILEFLDEMNLFIVPLDDERRWYRYHHLFAELLQQRLQKECPSLVPALHQQASKWYEENGFVLNAVSHALNAGEYKRTADLIEKSGWSVLMRGELATLLSWLEYLPEELLRSRPQLAFFNIWALAYSGALEEVEQKLQNVDLQSVRGEVATVRAHIAAVHGDITLAIALAHKASEQLPAENILLQGIVAQTLGLAYHWSGSPRAASQELSRAIKLSQEAGEPFLTMTAMAFLGRALEIQGELHQAVNTYQQMLELVNQPGRRPVPFTGMAYVGIAGSLYEWNDLDGAKANAIKGINLSEQGGFIPYQLAGSIILAHVYLACGDLPGAQEIIMQVGHLEQKCEYAYVLAISNELRTELWLEQGKMSAALQWAKHHPLSQTNKPSLAFEVEQITAVRILLARIEQLPRASADQIAKCLKHLEWLLTEAKIAERVGSIIRILVLQAKTLQIQGNHEAAVIKLGEALSLAEPEGYMRVFIDEGALIEELLRRTGSRGFAPRLVAELIAAIQNSPHHENIETQALIDPLSKRELEVLRLLADGYSNLDIADRCVITVGTVKAHTASIYRKLNVNSRSQAVARARELDLL